jgi:hypothetical protein
MRKLLSPELCRPLLTHICGLMLAGCAVQAPVITGSGAAFLPSMAASAAAPATLALLPDALEARVLAFAQASFGQKIGTGQCAELADHALTSNGANTFSDYAPVTNGDDYIWGTRIALTDARPGDIIQFRDYSVTVTTRSRMDEQSDSLDWSHHTAVVEQNVGDALLVLEQNVDDSQTVKRGRVPIRATTVSDGRVTTSTVIEGQLSAYRPKAG